MLKYINSKSNKTRVFINTLLVVSETILDKFLFFTINVILARYFSKELFGEYTSALAYATFFSIFCDIGINGTLIRCIRKDSSHVNEHITNALLIKTILVVLSYSALCITLFFVNYNRSTIYLILILGLVRIGNEYLKVFYSIFNTFERFLISSVSNTLFALTFLSVTIAVVSLQGNYYHVAWSRLGSVILFVLILVFIVLKKTKLKLTVESIKIFLPQMLYFGLTTVFYNANKSINTVLISLLSGTLFAGYFNNAFIFFTSVFFIPGNISRVLMPHLMKESFEEKPNKFQFTLDFYTRLYSVISFLIGLILFLYAEDIILLVYSKKYLPSASVLKVLAFAIPPLFSINTLMLTLLDLQKIRSLFEGIAFFVNVITTIILVYFFKTEGAAIAVIITYIVLNTLSGFYLAKQKYVHFKNVYMIYFKTIVITGITAVIYYLLLQDLIFYISLVQLIVIYGIFIVLFMANKNDIRIIKEIFKF